jgi:hypothetical protein
MSENMTVLRRLNRGHWRLNGGFFRGVLAAAPVSYRAQQLAAVTERGHAEFFEVLVCEIRKNGEIDVVLNKALSVLPETELLKPVRNLPHSGPARNLSDLG